MTLKEHSTKPQCKITRSHCLYYDIRTVITREEFPLVPEVLHHLCLSMYVTLNKTDNVTFAKNPNLESFNFRKADLVGLYPEL